MTRIRIATGEDGKDKTTVLLGAFPVSEGDAITAEPTGDGDAVKIRIRTDEYPRGYGKPWIARCVIKPDDPSRLANEWGEWRGRAAGKPGELEITARPGDVISFGQRHYDDDDQTIVLYARLTDGKLEQIPNREAALEALGGKRRAGCASVLAVACAVVVAVVWLAIR